MNDTFMKTKPVFPLLVSMALPNVISMLVNSLYNIVDSLFVAQINEQAMTALSLVFPIQNFVNAVAIGFGVGINALVALYRGAGDHDKADAAATHGMALSVLHGLLCTLLATAIMPGFLARFTADSTIVSMGVTYSTIVFFFAIVNMASLAFEKIFQAVGRMKLTMLALISGCVCNILLDPILIFGLGPVPALGIAGAALATGIGQTVTLVLYLVVYCTTASPVRLRRKALRPDASLEGRLYAIGVPAILNLALPSLLVTFLNDLLAAFSESYVVVLGIYYKLQTFLYLPVSGIVQGMRPLISYNYGAKEHARVAKLYQFTLGMSTVIMAAGTVICMAASAPLIGLFSSNPETIAIGQTALRIICLGFVVSSVSTTSSGALEDTVYFEKTRAAIVDTRAWTKEQLEARGFAVLDSRSNFLFVSTQEKNGGELYQKLKEKGVLVRHFDAPRIENWLRITIGTPEQMQIFLNTLDKIMEE